MPETLGPTILLTISESATRAGVSRTTMYRYVRDGLIAAEGDSRNRIHRDEVDRWLAQPRKRISAIATSISPRPTAARPHKASVLMDAEDFALCIQIADSLGASQSDVFCRALRLLGVAMEIVNQKARHKPRLDRRGKKFKRKEL